MNGYNLYRGALAQEKMQNEGAIVVNDDMVFVPQKYDNHFNAVVVSREDFEDMGYDTNKISDDKVKLARIQYRGKGLYIDEILK